MVEKTMQLFIGLLLGIIIAYLSYRAGALNGSGALAAALTGGLIFGLGGFPWAVLLLTFFVSSSGLSRAFAARKASLSEKFAKGSRRDWGQVFANGGLGALLAIVHFVSPAQSWLWLAFAGAMAAVNADTWATELGVLSNRPPRLISSGKIVERGASGGITLLGTLAALAGAALIGILAAAFGGENFLTLWGLLSLAGLLGSLFDSLLGATIQAIYFCPQCQKETERHPLHACGAETYRKRGWRWLNNDWVNFFCSVVGAAIAAGIYWLTVASG
jgi:uncharacterized protein (TIGR00297 family)